MVDAFVSPIPSHSVRKPLLPPALCSRRSAPVRRLKPRPPASPTGPHLAAHPLGAASALRVPPTADDDRAGMSNGGGGAGGPAGAGGHGGGAGGVEDAKAELKWRKQNATLVAEAQRNGLDAALDMLWDMANEGVAVTQNFNQVVSLLASRGRFDGGLELAEEAGRRGLANIITFRPLMKRCCSHGDGRGAKRVWKSMTRWNVEGDMFLYAELMGALVRAQDMVSAQRVLSSLHESGRRPHIVLYNTLLKGYARKANVRRGFEVLQTLEEADIKPDETTFNTLLNICVRANNPEALHRAMEQMNRHKVKPGAPTFNTILKLYSRAGHFDDALAIFEEMQHTVEPSIVTYNTLIDGCAHRGDMEQAARFFDEMIDRGMAPDICTMTSLLKGFGRANEPLRAVQLYEAMKQGGFKIEDRTRYAVINACLRANNREDAKRVVMEMLDLGIRVRMRTWVWLLECEIWAADEAAALETLGHIYDTGGLLEPSAKRMLLDELKNNDKMPEVFKKLRMMRTTDVRGD